MKKCKHCQNKGWLLAYKNPYRIGLVACPKCNKEAVKQLSAKQVLAIAS